MIKVLFVCLGNLCRSPMAQFVFKQMVDERGLSEQFEIDSAATESYNEMCHAGIHHGTREMLKSMRVPFEEHYSRRIRPRDYAYYDYILAMDDSNIEDIQSLVGMDTEHKIHYTNQFISESNHLSVAIVDEALLPKADYVGIVSGKNTDKSEVFAYDLSENNTPVIKDSPLVMDCEVVDNYETDSFDNFICKISGTYAEENVIDEKNKIDYNKLKPVLFEMPTYSYLKTGEIIGRGTEFGKKIKQQNKGE